MGAKRLDAAIGDAWKREACAYYANGHNTSETFEFIRAQYPVSFRTLRIVLKEAGVSRNKSAAQKLARFSRVCVQCNGEFQGRTPTVLMCDSCFGDKTPGVTPQKIRAYARHRRLQELGITERDVQSMRQAQNDGCGICGSRLTRPCIDHSHDTGKVRGLLCNGCNMMLGQIENKMGRAWLKNASTWLELR